MSTDYSNSTAAQLISSRQIDWWTVHLYFERLRDLLGVQSYPAAGTPAWDELDDDDPAKWLAVLSYGQHWALGVDTAQEAQCAASRDISKALDWPRAAKWLQDSAEWYAANPWMRRSA